MSFQEEEAFQLSCPPVHELTPTELEELFSLINQPAGFDPASPSSGSHGSNRAVYSKQERRLRRKQSNRESARRSRWRKKRHLENLTNQVNRLKAENRELKTGLGLAVHRNMLFSLENERLRSECVTLLAQLSDLYQILGNMISQ